ncbi:MAG: radical SAM protein [Deltaproteobacteria bacterium]|nr:radical SAM protein [Deltaproteobacteria bacterium]
MNKTILLINPWIHDFAAFDYWIKPLGLLYIGSFLRNNGYHVELIDCLDPWNPQMRKELSPRAPRRFADGQGKYFRETITKPAALKSIPKKYHRYGLAPHILRAMLLNLPQPQMIMITSMMTYWYPGVFETISIVKEIMPGVPVVMGGNYATLCPQHAARSGADFVLSGNGEAAIAALMKAEFNVDLPFPADPGNLDSSPYPAYDLVHHPDQLPIMTSRGCPFTCTYCASGILNPSFLRRDPDQVFAELEFWHQSLHVQNFSLYDDAFLVQPLEMAIPLLEEIIKHHLPWQFHCPNGLHIREVNDEIAMLMFKAGFKTIRFGFETADIARQQETGGKVTNSELQQAVQCLVKAGYRQDEIGIYLLCGLPQQTATEVRESILFVKSCGAKPILAEYSPIPGTALWDEAVQVSPFNIEAEPLYHNNTLLPCQGDNFTDEMYQSLKSLTRLPT